MCQYMTIFHTLGFFLPLIMKNVFEKLALYRGFGANTLLITDLPKVFLKNGDIVLKIQAGCWKCDNERGCRF